jgi:hypothetical protein
LLGNLTESRGGGAGVTAGGGDFGGFGGFAGGLGLGNGGTVFAVSWTDFAVSGTDLAVSGTDFTVSWTDFTVDPTVSVAFSTSPAEAVGTETAPIRIVPAARVATQRRSRPNANSILLVRLQSNSRRLD